MTMTKQGKYSLFADVLLNFGVRIGDRKNLNWCTSFFAVSKCMESVRNIERFLRSINIYLFEKNPLRVHLLNLLGQQSLPIFHLSSCLVDITVKSVEN